MKFVEFIQSANPEKVSWHLKHGSPRARAFQPEVLTVNPLVLAPVILVNLKTVFVGFNIEAAGKGWESFKQSHVSVFDVAWQIYKKINRIKLRTSGQGLQAEVQSSMDIDMSLNPDGIVAQQKNILPMSSVR